MVTFDAAMAEAWLAAALLPFLRILALFSAAPLFSARALPGRIRIAAAGAIAMACAALAPVSVPPGLVLASAQGLGLVAQQVAVGLAVGFAVRLMFAAIEMAGEVIGLQMGLSFAGFVNPQGGSQPAVASWLNTLAMLAYLSLNAHLLVLDALLATFRSLPIAPLSLATLASLRLEQLGADVFRLGLSLALPSMALMLLVNLVMGFASRIAPQLSIFSVGFPVTLLAGMALLSASTGHLGEAITQALPAFLGPLR